MVGLVRVVASYAGSPILIHICFASSISFLAPTQHAQNSIVCAFSLPLSPQKLWLRISVSPISGFLKNTGLEHLNALKAAECVGVLGQGL